MKRILTVATLVLTLATPVQAAEDGPAAEAEKLAREMEQAAREAAKELMGVLTLFIGRIPQYEAPEILDNGDIIIRRKQPKTAEPPQPREKPGNGPRNGEVTDL